MKKNISHILEEYAFLWGEETPGKPYETLRSPEPATTAAPGEPAVTSVEESYCSGNAAYWDAYSAEACPLPQPVMVQAWQREYRAGEAEDAEIDRQTPKLREILLPRGGWGTRQQADGSWLFWGPIDQGDKRPDRPGHHRDERP